MLRNDDLDLLRCKSEFVSAMYNDLRWFGFEWQEGPDIGGPFAPYSQSDRFNLYRSTLAKLHDKGWIYPCVCSRKDIQAAASAPHAADDEETIYPGTCRTRNIPGSRCSWRFRVPDGETISFFDGNFGPQQFVAGKDFGDFVVWRPDDVPAYQLACVIDDAAMQISEVVRGADLLMSTARQLLLYNALKIPVPQFFHCALMTDEHGVRLAKRHKTLSLRHLRLNGAEPEKLRTSL